MKDGVITSPDTLRGGDRLPPGQRLVADWPVLHHGEPPDIELRRWRLRIHGLCAPERTLDYDAFLALPRVLVRSDIHCVTGWSRFDNLWEGVSTRTLGGLVEIDPTARHVVVHGHGGFTTNLPLDDFFAVDSLIAVKHDGELLDIEHGYPARLVVPRLYFWKSAKWVTAIEFTAEDRPGFWEKRGYHNHGDPWKEERYGEP